MFVFFAAVLGMLIIHPYCLCRKLTDGVSVLISLMRDLRDLAVEAVAVVMEAVATVVVVVMEAVATVVVAVATVATKAMEEGRMPFKKSRQLKYFK
jgi:hypothetical protein